MKKLLSNVLATVYKKGVRETSRKRQENVKKGDFEARKRKKGHQVRYLVALWGFDAVIGSRRRMKSPAW